MEGVIDHHTVEQHLVLDGRTTTDVKLTALVAGEDDTRHHLQVLGEVGLTTYTRNLGDGLRCDSDDRSFGLGAGLNLIGSNRHRFQLLARLFHEILAADGLVSRQAKALRNGVVTHICDQQRILPVGDAVDIEIAVFVGCAAKGCAFQVDIGEHHRLARGFFINETFDAIVLCHSRQCSEKQEKSRKKQS